MKKLWSHVDPASLAIFRVLFGFILFCGTLRYFFYDWVQSRYIHPEFHFTYFGFSWVRPLPGLWMTLLFAGLCILALAFAFGFLFRLVAPLLFLVYTYIFLIDRTYYQNHEYLICLLSFLFCFTNANALWSFDSWRSKARKGAGIPVWQIETLKFQIAIVYFFGGLAKVDPNWLNGDPLRIWFAQRSDWPILGKILTVQWAPNFFSWSGLFIDLTLPILLYVTRLRWFGIAIGVGFHLLNGLIWDIDIFPYLMIAAFILYLPPNWSRQFIKSKEYSQLNFGLASPQIRRVSILIAAVSFLFYFSVQLFLPIRHFLYPGHVSWTRQGDLFAWRMMLYDFKGKVRLIIQDPKSKNELYIPFRKMLTADQADTMEINPEMVLEFCHHISKIRENAKLGHRPIRAFMLLSSNGRPERQIVDPNIDLTLEPRRLGNYRWIYPIE